MGVPHWRLGSVICPLADDSPECGNHNWVEVYVDGQWHFIDQWNQAGALDSAWFYPEFSKQNSIHHQGNHSIYATSFLPLEEMGIDYPSGGEPADHFPMVWDWSNTQVRAWDVSGRYKVDELEILFI